MPAQKGVRMQEKVRRSSPRPYMPPVLSLALSHMMALSKHQGKRTWVILSEKASGHLQSQGQDEGSPITEMNHTPNTTIPRDTCEGMRGWAVSQVTEKYERF